MLTYIVYYIEYARLIPGQKSKGIAYIGKGIIEYFAHLK